VREDVVYRVPTWSFIITISACGQCISNQSFSMPVSHDTRTGGSLPLQASAPQPAIKHNPPSGVTGPRALNLCGSSTSRYIEPENIVIPAVKRPIASLFCGAATVVRRRTPEWTSCVQKVLVSELGDASAAHFFQEKCSKGLLHGAR